MAGYLLRRILSAVPTLFLLVTLTFFLLRLAPGGPFDSDQAWPPEIQAHILHKYELDRPLSVQFVHWLQGLKNADLGESFQYLDRSVTEIVGQTLPNSLLLGGGALVLSILFGIILGSLSAWKHSGVLDRVISMILVSGLSLPSYLLASLLILIFSLWLNWLPPALWESPVSMVLPVITLAWRPMAMIGSLTRRSMIETFKADYIRTAYGKGLAPVQVIFKHALKNSLIPVISLLGPIAANLVTGSFLVESVFQIPGIGKYFVQAVINRDYPLVMGITLVYGVILLSSNLMTDLLSAWADPRIRI